MRMAVAQSWRPLLLFIVVFTTSADCAAPAKSVDDFFYAGNCEEPGENCIITRKDDPLPLAAVPSYKARYLRPCGLCLALSVLRFMVPRCPIPPLPRPARCAPYVPLFLQLADA